NTATTPSPSCATRSPATPGYLRYPHRPDPTPHSAHHRTPNRPTGHANWLNVYIQWCRVDGVSRNGTGVTSLTRRYECGSLRTTPEDSRVTIGHNDLLRFRVSGSGVPRTSTPDWLWRNLRAHRRGGPRPSAVDRPDVCLRE